VAYQTGQIDRTWLVSETFTPYPVLAWEEGFRNFGVIIPVMTVILRFESLEALRPLALN
jgi:hypothetical protein